MRFTGERSVAASSGEVWTALHDHEVLRRAVPGCRRLEQVGPARYAATIGVQVGPLGDTYRGHFEVHGDPACGSLRVQMAGRGRGGRLELDLQVELAHVDGGATSLRYDAQARVSGLVARLGSPTLSVAGAHLTACFFRDLDRALRTRSRQVALAG